jgi:hypothetical protein
VLFIFRIVIFVAHYCTHLPFILEVNFIFQFVLSFDMSDEVFLKTPLSDTYSKGAEQLFVLNELIAMTIDEQYFELIYDLWSLLKVGIKDS